MCWYNDGGWWPLDSGTRRARKRHRCEAGCRIEPGDTYHYWVGVFEGDFSTGKACVACWAAAAALGAACRIYEPDSDDPQIYELVDAYREHLEHGELPLDVVPPKVVRQLRNQYAALLERVA